MSTFDDILKLDADNTFLGEFAESVAYTPASGSPLPIKAVVVKNPLEKSGATPRELTTEIHVHVSRTDIPNRPTLGGDKITIAGIAQAMFVVRIVDESDPGMWHLMVK